MKNILNKVMKAFISVLPVMAMFAVTVSANTIASPTCGQPISPINLKKYRKF